MNYIELRNGYSIPAVGMGTGWMNTGYKNPKYLAKRIFEELNMRIKGIYSKEQNYTVSYELRKLIKFKRCISQVAKVGYTLFDVANNYNNLALVSQGIDLKNNRDKYIIISKCSNTSQRNGTVREEFEKALKELDTDYLDVFLIHWPQTNEYLKTWHVLEYTSS